MDRFLKECGVPYTLLSAKTDPISQGTIRGTAQRNAALKWLRDSFKRTKIRGVVFFGDDDNTYHPDLFKEVIIQFLVLTIIVLSVLYTT